MDSGETLEMDSDNLSKDTTTEQKDDNTSVADTEDKDGPFKKPTFAPPSVVPKRGNVKSSDKEASSVSGNEDALVPEDAKRNHGPHNEQESQSSEGVIGENVSPKTDEAKNMSTQSSDSTRVPTKTIQDVKPKPKPKAPPAGKFKPNPPLPYTEPPWGCPAVVPYALEILKTGTIVDSIPLTQNSYFVIGRLPLCDVALEHPSISRYHAILQHRGQSGETGEIGEETGFYVYDLSSTHGTFVNKNKIPPKTYIRLKVGHVLKFGGSTRLFILQGPESDEESESELTVTELRERARKQRELEERMMGDGSDEENEKDEEKSDSVPGKSSTDESGCSWGMAEEAAPEDENEENPFATEFQEDQEAAYLKDPKKALQGFYDREGEELEFEYEEKGHGSWLCRVRLPVDDAHGKQLVAEVTHTGKKKEASIQCSLEACRILEARGLLRQEAVSRKRRKKNWEDEDFYDSDDDNFLDRTGTVEKKRKERMKRAGKVEDQPASYESLTLKLNDVEKEIAETENKLRSSGKGGQRASSDDPLDAFMNVVSSETTLDSVERKKLHVHIAELRKEAQRLHRLIDLTRPTQLPSLQSGTSSNPDKPKKPALPMFGAMKGGSKFKLKTGTIGTLPPKRACLPPELFNMKEMPEGGEEEEDEEEEGDEEEEKEHVEEEPQANVSTLKEHAEAKDMPVPDGVEKEQRHPPEDAERPHSDMEKQPLESPKQQVKEKSAEKRPRKPMGPSRPPSTLSGSYPEDDPDYSVWVPPKDQSGDGRTHLNEKYGY
ncbi:kanadaptin [Sardina pilchardus]|uniref:kanadaptin n=1 Tax=Sardina pilchardus TaxID=27697 RepID=UPI002E15A1F7